MKFLLFVMIISGDASEYKFISEQDNLESCFYAWNALDSGNQNKDKYKFYCVEKKSYYNMFF